MITNISLDGDTQTLVKPNSKSRICVLPISHSKVSCSSIPSCFLIRATRPSLLCSDVERHRSLSRRSRFHHGPGLFSSKRGQGIHRSARKTVFVPHHLTDDLPFTIIGDRLPIINDVGRAPGSTVSLNSYTKYTTDIPIVDAAVAKQVNATDLVRFHLHRTEKIN
jgi:hypothetical protein